MNNQDLSRDRSNRPEEGEKAAKHHERATEQSGHHTRHDRPSAQEEEAQDGDDRNARQRVIAGCKSGVKELRVQSGPGENSSQNLRNVVPQGQVSRFASIEHLYGSLVVSLLCTAIFFFIDIKAGLAFVIPYVAACCWHGIEAIVAALRGEFNDWKGRNPSLFIPLISGRFTLAIVALSLGLVIGWDGPSRINHWLLTDMLLGMVSGLQSGVSDAEGFSKLNIIARLLTRKNAT